MTQAGDDGRLRQDVSAGRDAYAAQHQAINFHFGAPAIPLQREPGRRGKLRAFVSSTFTDLRDCREQVRKALQRLGVADVAMETYTAEEARPVDKCLADVRSCDVYIGLFAWRYGFVPDGHQHSITELEYRAAGAAGIPRLVFLLREDAPWPPTLMDLGNPAQDRIRALRSELTTAHVCEFFSSAQDLRPGVSEAVGRWMQTTGHGLDAEPGITAATVSAWNAYNRRLTEQYRGLDLDALTPPDREEYLQIQLREVFVEPNVREDVPPAELSKELQRKLQDAAELSSADVPKGLDRQDLEDARRTYRARPATPAFDVLTSVAQRACVLLGDPGAGKSTLARYVSLVLIDERPDDRLEPLQGYQPVLVELREYALHRQKYETFTDYLAYRHRSDGLGVPAEVLDQYLTHNGRALMIFDGLDELFDQREREAVSLQIAGFAAAHPQARILVTSRIIGYRPRVLRDAGFGLYTVQDLDPRQVDAFLGSWYELALHDRPAMAAERRQRLASAISESPPIRELAGNPLLLTILAIIGKHQELPRERWKVYDHAASVLVQHWDINKHLNDVRIDAALIREDDKKELLRRLAHRMQEGVRGLAGNHLWEDDLSAEIRNYLRFRFQYGEAQATAVATAMIEQFRTRNFVLARYGPGVYGFVHRALLEFFCASEIVSRFEKTRELTEADLTSRVYAAHWEDPAWAEVLRLIAGMVDATIADQLITYLLTEARPIRSTVLDRPPLGAVVLAVQCLAEVRNLGAAAGSARLVLRSIIDLLRCPIRSFKDDRDGTRMDTILPIIATIGARWPGRDIYLDWFRAQGRRATLRPAAQQAARIAAALFPDSPDIAGLLAEGALTGASAQQRRACLLGHAAAWTDAPRTRQLVDRSCRDPAPVVRRAAIEVLTTHWPAASDTLDILLLMVRDVHADVRKDALEALNVHWSGATATYPAVLGRAAHDPSRQVRQAAVECLGSRWPDRDETRAALGAACSDPAWEVRRAAVKALATRLTQEDESYLAVQHALADADEDVRAAAVEVLSSRWTDRPDTLLMVCRAAEDIDDTVRKAALGALVARWPDHKRTHAVLRRLATDLNGEVRCTAIEAKIRRRRLPDPVAALLDEAARDASEAVRRATIETLARSWPEEPGSRSAFLQALPDPSPDVRKAAITALAEHWVEHPETRAALERAVVDLDPGVREAALLATATYWADEPASRDLFVRVTRFDSWRLRQMALETLVACWPTAPETMAALARGCRDEAGIVRQTAIEAFAADPDASPAHQATVLAATRDDHHGTRTSAVDAMAASWMASWHSQTAVATALRSQDAAVRRTAVLTLATRWTDQPTTWRAIHRCLADACADVRAASLDILAAHRTERPDSVDAFLRATHDPQGSIRNQALHALAATWSDHPGTGEALLRALRDPHEDVRQTALETLALRTAPDGRIHAALGEASRDRNWGVRRMALDTLAARWDARPGSLAAVRDASLDSDENVRSAALIALSTRWADHPDTLDRIVGRLRDYSANVRRDSFEILATRWRDDPRSRELVRRARRDPDSGIRWMATTAPAIFGTGSDLAGVEDAVVAARHENNAHRLAGLQALLLRWPDRPEALAAARAGVVDATMWSVRETALHALGTRWLADPEAGATVLRGTTHPDPGVRVSAVRALGCWWPTHPDARPAFHRAVRSSTAKAAVAALQALVEHLPDHPDTLSAVLGATRHPEPDVRQAALRTLTARWYEHAETLAALRRAAEDVSPDVRTDAVKALTNHWSGHPDTLAVLHWATYDPNAAVRAARRSAMARQERARLPTSAELHRSTRASEWTIRFDSLALIVARWPGDPETLRAVRRLTADGDPDLRHDAIRLLAEFWPDQPATLRAVQEATTDVDWWVRYGAVEELGRKWPDNPESSGLIHAAAKDPDQFVRYLALSLLTIRWLDRAEVMPTVVAAATVDANNVVGQQAVMVLAAAWPEAREVVPAVRAATYSSLIGTRWLANEALIAWGESAAHPHIPRLAEPAALLIAARSRNHAARCDALQELAGRFSDHRDTLPALRRATESSCPGVRHAALNGILAAWADHVETPAHLRRAAADPDPAVRHSALAHLASNWPQSPATHAALKQGTRDDDLDIRTFAIGSLLRVAPDVDLATKNQPLEDRNGNYVHGFLRKWLDWRGRRSAAAELDE
ncbi:HEAT repeat domain-containing protein [Micromonospora sp. NPDC005203]|uniref:HEAT repeat domain-containing protein n=1 Tax=Micromonospora sp. NPDC005203 TaxID=3364226 RepID=UPI0036A4DF48